MNGAGRTGRPPETLTRLKLAARLRAKNPLWPAELARAAAAEIIRALAGALAEGRPVSLNGFGRFSVRRYRGSRKKIGLIFRPSASLRNRLNPSAAE